MCLIISVDYHPDYEPFVADKDIEVVKFLQPEMDNQVSNEQTDGTVVTLTEHYPLRTPYQYVPIEFKDGRCAMQAPMVLNLNSTANYTCSLPQPKTISQGIHAYRVESYEKLHHYVAGSLPFALTMKLFELIGYTPYSAYIPKGSKYYFGIDGDVVAEKMVIRDKILPWRTNCY